MDSQYLRLSNQRVALVTNIPRPYRQLLYETMSERIAAVGGEFKVFFYSEHKHHARRQASEPVIGHYANALVAGLDVPLGYDRVLSIPTRLVPALHSYRPGVVLAGTFGPPAYAAWLYTRAAGIPYVQWSGATAAQGRPNGPLTGVIQGFLARHAESCISYGTAAAEYLREMGVRPERLVTGVNAVDNPYFAEQARLMRPQAERLKIEHGLHGVNLLYVGNLVQRKGIAYVLEALHRIAAGAGAFHLHLVGAGPYEAELRALAARLGLAERVHFWGARPPETMPLFYALADVFVFPSLYDVWGLVLNEAMASRLPVVSSTLAGATRDLVEDGTTGIAVNPHDVPALAAALRRLIMDPALRDRLGAAAALTVEQKATIAHSATAFLQAIHLALCSCPTPAPFATRRS